MRDKHNTSSICITETRTLMVVVIGFLLSYDVSLLL